MRLQVIQGGSRRDEGEKWMDSKAQLRRFAHELAINSEGKKGIKDDLKLFCLSQWKNEVGKKKKWGRLQEKQMWVMCVQRKIKIIKINILDKNQHHFRHTRFHMPVRKPNGGLQQTGAT